MRRQLYWLLALLVPLLACRAPGSERDAATAAATATAAAAPTVTPTPEATPAAKETLSQSRETRRAKVLDGKRLVVEETDGITYELARVDGEIVELAWLPDGRHLLFVEVDRSEQIEGMTIGLKHALWLVDADTRALTQLGSFAEDLHQMRVAPDGRHVALVSGSGFGDACFVDRQLRIMALNADFQRLALYERADFAGAPLSEELFIYPGRQQKTGWENVKTVRVPFDVTCIDFSRPGPGRQLRGIYLLDVETMTAVRASDLPIP